ncbi:vitamin K epoxide reductase family protein [Microbacterium jejuense]|uniref:Vitamin K epoxide reductase family protein n=1 Tax=Microbacterium jejuense TaxID=1263637 RepID=A0ABS7HP80_9MICO|nr:vitamin K epoxide reductase family protein [Microbacterium jejuense]MBW9094772.1 vitamin K epoxide reductase family protein [Microbacterium jejuense]
MVTSPAERPEARTHYALALVLIVGGLLGLLASFALTMDDINLLKNPDTALTCNLNAVVNCGKNIESWQGSIFGFPNPILGLMMFPAPVVVGFALLARARFAGWFWWIFNAGLLFAIAFVYWLAFQSIFDIGTLCPWCSLVYLVTIPMFLGVTVRNLRAGLAGRALQKFGDAISGWVPLIAIAGYVIIFGAAQLHLNILATLF